MATVRRHPVPSDSYEPDRPLNDLGRDQFEHFKHAASRFPEQVRAGLPPIASPEDGIGASRFIAAVTQVLMARKRQPLQLVSQRRRRQETPEPGLALAASAEAPSASAEAPALPPPLKKRARPGSTSGGRST